MKKQTIESLEKQIEKLKLDQMNEAQNSRKRISSKHLDS